MQQNRILNNAYTLEKKIGRTHLGDVYLGKTLGTECKVRVNMLTDLDDVDDESIARFMQQADLLRSLKHVNLWCAIDSGKDGDTYFFVTQYEPCISLDKYLAKVGTVDERQALKYALKIADVLNYIWGERKLVHRNLKPQNIFVTRKNDVRLTGFDIVKLTSGNAISLTGAGYTLGTPEYMSPEQIRATESLDFRSDLFSLGVVVYETLVGTPPISDDVPLMVIHRQCEEIPPSACERNPGVSAECSAVVDKMLAKDPNDRYQTWVDFIDAASDVLDQRHGKKPLRMPPKPVPKKKSRPVQVHEFSPHSRAVAIVEWICTIPASPLKIIAITSIILNILTTVIIIILLRG